MEIGFRLADVFTEVPLQGNRLCVVPEAPTDLSAERMQALALETNFAETTFVTKSGSAGYTMRIFTPDEELPFAGHPTIGTAFTLANEGRTSTRPTQTTAIGEVAVEVELDRGFAWMTQRSPEFGPEFDDRAGIAGAATLGPDDLHPDLPIQRVSTGLWPLLVPVRDEATLRRAARDDAACRRVVEATGSEYVYLFAVRGPGDGMARMFDTVRGSARIPRRARPPGRSAPTSRHAVWRECRVASWSRRGSWSGAPASSTSTCSRPTGRGRFGSAEGSGSSARACSGSRGPRTRTSGTARCPRSRRSPSR